MKVSNPEGAKAGLDLATSRRTKLRAHFDRFCANVAGGLKANPIDGLTVTTAAEKIIVDFLGRRLRINFRFDYKNNKGSLHIEDTSAEDRPAMYLGRIEFDSSGITPFPGGHISNYQFGAAKDCRALLLSIVVEALDCDPWERPASFPVEASSP